MMSWVRKMLPCFATSVLQEDDVTQGDHIAVYYIAWPD